MIIAIDGPAGAGKSTVARALAARLGFAFLDTGALYRATALGSLRSGQEAAAIVRDIDIRLGERILLDGEDVSAEIRTPGITELTHHIATDPAVRKALTELQRKMIHRGDWVAEGRDIGTIVAPDAELKIFLTASLAERARRRSAESGHAIDEVRWQLSERDKRDAEREHAPLVPADDAVLIDTSTSRTEEVVDMILSLVPNAAGGAPALFARTPEEAVRALERRHKSRVRPLGANQPEF